VKDYFAAFPIFDNIKFKLWYRMHRSLFLKIIDSVYEFDPYFLQSRDSLGQGSFFWLQNTEGELVVGVFATNHQPQVLPPYFAARKKNPSLGWLGLSSLHKCTSAICMLGYCVAADATDEYYCLGERRA
jgi:hypothetical protein